MPEIKQQEGPEHERGAFMCDRGRHHSAHSCGPAGPVPAGFRGATAGFRGATASFRGVTASFMGVTAGFMGLPA